MSVCVLGGGAQTHSGVHAQGNTDTRGACCTFTLLHEEEEEAPPGCHKWVVMRSSVSMFSRDWEMALAAAAAAPRPDAFEMDAVADRKLFLRPY